MATLVLVAGLQLLPGVAAEEAGHGAAAEAAHPPATTQAAAPAHLQFGVAPGSPFSVDKLDLVTGQAGESPTLVMSYEAFGEPVPLDQMDALHRRGAVPVLTWEPWTKGNGADQPSYALARVIAGDFDGYITQWGAKLAAWHSPVMLRFAHEMNGDWYPWGDGVNGNTPRDYIGAWRHVHDLLVNAGASNVIWVWTPNATVNGMPSQLGKYYPGDSYVDMVGLDGYNWGASDGANRWQQPAEIFSNGLAQLRTIAPSKPVLIGETASAEQGGSKAEWISQLVDYLAQQRDVVGFIWFNVDKETDWRIDSSPQSVAALRAALKRRP